MRDIWARTFRRIKRAIRARRFLVAVSTAISATLVLTAISLTIYKIGGFYRYDLSRPGYEKERQEISTTPTDVIFDTTSPLSKQGIDPFLQQLDEYRQNLEDYNAFDNGGLADEDLQLTPGQQTNTSQ